MAQEEEQISLTRLLNDIFSREDTTPTTEERAAIKAGWLTKEEGVKRSPNPWILYRAHKSREIEMNGDLGGQSRCIADMWKGLSDEDRLVWTERAALVKDLHHSLFPTYTYKPIRKSTNTPHTTPPPSQEILPHASPSTNTAPARNKRERKTQRVAPYPIPQRAPAHPPVSAPRPAPFVPPNTVHRRLTGKEERIKELDMVAMAFPNVSLNQQIPSLFESAPLSAHHPSQQFHQPTIVPSSAPLASAPSGFWPGNQCRQVPSHVDAPPPMWRSWGVSTSNFGQASLPPANDIFQSSRSYGVGSSSLPPLSLYGFGEQQQFYSM